MITNHTAYKYETPYKFPFVITQCFNNGAVNLQYGPIYTNKSGPYINQILKLKITIK